MRRIALIAVAAGAAAPVLAQPAAEPHATPDIGQQIAGKPPAPAPLPAPPNPADCPFAGQNLSVTLSRVEVSGATVVTPGEVDDAVADLVGSPRDLAVVCQARDRVAALYAGRGYRLTRVNLPPQTISGGVLRLSATEGFVSTVDVSGLAGLGPSRALAARYLDRLKAEKPTPWAAIERQILLARDIPGADMALRLHAAPGAPGAVEVVAAAPPRRIADLSVGLQQMGGAELGRTALFGRLDLNGLTRFGDRTSVILYGTTTGSQRVVEGVESFFIGASGLRATAEVDYARTHPRGVLAPLDIDGDFLDASARLDYPFVRRQAFSLWGSARFDYINQKNDLGVLRGLGGPSPVLFEDRLRLLTLSLDARWRPPSIRQLEASGGVDLAQGVGGLGGSHRGDAGLSRGEGDPLATVVRGEAAAAWRFRGREGFERRGGPWVSIAGQAQWANHPLTAYSEFQIGPYTVGRGFDPGAASGDRAAALSVEAGWRFPRALRFLGPQARRSYLEPFAFADLAWLKNLDAGGYTAKVASAGGGLRAELPWRLRLEATWAEPLTRPFPGAPRQRGRMLVSLSRVFSFR